jgi:hypothetical protein
MRSKWEYPYAERKSSRGMKMDKNLEPFRAAIELLQRLLHKFNDRGVTI